MIMISCVGLSVRHYEIELPIVDKIIQKVTYVIKYLIMLVDELILTSV